jgi:hypothetical protein
MPAAPEQEPLLREQHEAIIHTPNATRETHTVDSKVEPVVLIVIMFGVFLSMACESFVATTHEEIASFFNNLWMGPWLLTAYGMGYSMMLPLVSQHEPNIALESPNRIVWEPNRKIRM